MFSIVNEISNNSHRSTTSVITVSVGWAGVIYFLVAVPGYLSYGDNVNGNIISMCTFHPPPSSQPQYHPHFLIYTCRSTKRRLNNRPPRHRHPSHVLLPPPMPPYPRKHRQRTQMAPLKTHLPNCLTHIPPSQPTNPSTNVRHPFCNYYLRGHNLKLYGGNVCKQPREGPGLGGQYGEYEYLVYSPGNILLED